MKSRVKTGFYNLLQIFISRLPIEFSPLKRGFYNAFGAHIAGNSLISDGVWIESPEYLVVGDSSWIDRDVMITCGPSHKPGRTEIHKPLASRKSPEVGQMIIGERVHIAPKVVIQAHGGVMIGDCTTVASGSKIYSMSHHYRNISDPADPKRYKFTSRAPPEEQLVIVSPVIFEENTAIGLNGVVLPGTLIGRGSWIAAGSVVRGVFEGDVVIGGNPAKILKRIETRGAPTSV